jgi:hypothetical protein
MMGSLSTYYTMVLLQIYPAEELDNYCNVMFEHLSHYNAGIDIPDVIEELSGLTKFVKDTNSWCQVYSRSSRETNLRIDPIPREGI